MNVLYLSHLGNIQYFSKLCFSECVVDVYENYVKQSYRNRCEIMTANGRAGLTVNLVNPGNFSRTPMKDVRIDNSKKWRHIHWQSVVSSYGNSPFFEYYADLFEPFYTREFRFLYDLNRGLTDTVLKILGCGKEPVYSEKYIDLRPGVADIGLKIFGNTPEDIRDYRAAISPKARLKRDDPFFTPEPYWQVFSDRFPFAENLSIIDLLFCEGPSAMEVLRKSYKGDLIG